MKKKIITTKELQELLHNTVLILDCGHKATIGKSLSNTVIIYHLGKGKIKTVCWNCGF